MGRVCFLLATMRHKFLVILLINVTSSLDPLSIITNFRISFDENLLTIKPIPNVEHQIEIENGYLKGVNNGTFPKKVITGFHYTEIITENNINKITKSRKIKFETVTCSQLSPMLGRYILQEIMQGMGFDKNTIKNYDVCAFRVSVYETNEVYTIKFSRGVLEAKFNLGNLDSVVSDYINNNLANEKGNFGFKLKIKMVDGEVELVGTDVNGEQYIKIRPERLIEDGKFIWDKLVELSEGGNGLSDILRLAIYFDKVLQKWEHVEGVEIVKPDVSSIFDSLWGSGVDILGHFMNQGRNVFLDNVESLFDEEEAQRTINWFKNNE